MAQSITLKIAGKDYQFVAQTPESERLMRLAAENINAMYSKYDERFPDKTPVDKLAFVSLMQSMNMLQAQNKATKLSSEADALKAELDAYLANIEANR